MSILIWITSKTCFAYFILQFCMLRMYSLKNIITLQCGCWQYWTEGPSVFLYEVIFVFKMIISMLRAGIKLLLCVPHVCCGVQEKYIYDRQMCENKSCQIRNWCNIIAILACHWHSEVWGKGVDDLIFLYHRK